MLSDFNLIIILIKIDAIMSVSVSILIYSRNWYIVNQLAFIKKSIIKKGIQGYNFSEQGALSLLKVGL